MALLVPATLGAPFSGTDHNNNLLLIESSLGIVGPYVTSGLVQSAGTGLSVNVTAGTALIGGTVTKASTWTIGSLTPSNTNHLYLLNTGAGTSNTTGTQPANSVKLGTATTDGTGVTAVDTTGASGRQEKLSASGLNVFLKDSDQTLSEGVDISVGTATGTKLATATAQKLGFWNATPVVQVTGATDVLAGLVTIGLRAASSNPPLNLGTGAITAGSITVPGVGTNSEHYGASSAAAGTRGQAFGNATSAGGQDSLAAGQNCNAGATRSIALGNGNSAGNTDSICLGANMASTANGQLVIGNTSTGTLDVYIGKGVTHATPTALSLNATGGSGTDIAGGALTVAGGRPTGSGLGGSILLATAPAGASGTTLRSLVTRWTLNSTGLMTIAEAGNIAVGTTTGSKIGTSNTQKIAFWNATPVVQPAANADTSGATLGDLETEVNQLKQLLRDVGLMAP